MFGTVIITFVITALSISTLFMYDRCHQQDRETHQLRRTNDNLHKQISDYRMMEQERREDNAYNRGLYDGRETDVLYRKMLSKYSKGEHTTIMMHGTQSNNDRTEVQ